MNQFENNELYHHGIKGMKWGVRRYQNPDGTLTSAGRKRLGLSKEDSKKLNKEQVHNMAYTNAASDYSNLGKGLNTGSNMSRSSASAINKTSRIKKNKMVDQEDVSKLTDQELQRRVNRMNLERNYKSLKRDQISLGRDRVAEYLDIAGDVISGLGSAAMVAGTIYMIKRGGFNNNDSGKSPIRFF